MLKVIIIPNMLTIKRYPNRKFYNPDSRQYITLEGIANLIREGRDLQVIDHASGEDLTTLVLTQIILEQERQKSGFMPRSVLTSLVKSSGSTLTRMRQILATPADWLRQVDEEIERRIERLNQLGDLTDEDAATFRRKLIVSSEDVAAEIDETVILNVLAKLDLPTRGELEQLNRQLDSLLEQLSALGVKTEEL